MIVEDSVGGVGVGVGGGVGVGVGAGGVSGSGAVYVTVIVKPAVPTFPELSVAVHVTGVVPT